MIAKTLRSAPAIGAMLLLLPFMALAAVPGAFSQQGRSTIQAVAGAAPQEEMVTRLIVKPRSRAGDRLDAELRAHDASRLAKTANRPLFVVRQMSGGAHVLRLDQAVTLSEARVIAARLMRDGSVERVEPDRFIRPMLTPNDPFYSGGPHPQWNLQTLSASNLGSANLPGAWDISTGSNTVTVAVVDTGYYQHSDLAPVLPGYDFISNIPVANDNDGRDTDASDPGDWVNQTDLNSGNFPGCTTSDIANSSWHGTHVAGIIAATMNNGLGIAGVAPNVRILPVRVLGKCGGFTSDIVDGMEWAAGRTVPNVPANANPAKVLNLSLGSSGNCSTAFQSAVTDVVNAGATVVVATGNEGNLSVDEPANCTGVIAVTANSISGDNAYYANIGPGTFISAPGGGCGGTSYPTCPAASSVGVYSLVNSGTTSPVAAPGGDSYASYSGTSMATPHVSGVIALMLSVDPTLTPAQIKSYLQSTVRPHPAGTLCATGGVAAGQCGAGLLDAAQALTTVRANAIPPVVTLGSIPAVVAPGTVVTLSGSAVAAPGKAIVSYAWTQQTGPTVAIGNANSATATFTAPPTGTCSFTLTATDDHGKTGTATAIVRVNSPPALNAVAAQSVTVGQTLSFTVTATDPDGDTPIFHSVSLPSGATLSATGNFNWPNASPIGSYTLTYYASDNDADSAQGTVNITVAAAPPAVAAPAGGGGGGSFDGALLAALVLLAVLRRCAARTAMKP